MGGTLIISIIMYNFIKEKIGIDTRKGNEELRRTNELGTYIYKYYLRLSIVIVKEILIIISRRL